jgi:hypothetical protein
MEEIDKDSALLESYSKVDELSLTKEYCEFAGQYSYFTQKYATAYKAALVAKHQLDVCKQAAYIRAKETSVNGKPPTDKYAQAVSETSLEVSSAFNNYSEAEAEKVWYKNAVDVLSAKREMLISLGAKIRVEMAGNPALMEKYNNG